MHSLFNQSQDLLCIAGTDGIFKKVNPAFTTLLGWDKETLLRTSYFDLIHPDDIEDTKIQVSKLALGEAAKNFVTRFNSNTGQYYAIQWNVLLDPATGNLISIGRNITELKIIEDRLKASEDHFRTFFENSQGLMCTHDLDGTFLSVNSVGAGILGYRPDELINTSLQEIIPAKHHPAFQNYLHEISQTGKSTGLMSTLHKNGSVKIWNYHNTLVTGRDGSKYVIGNSIDVTEGHLMEKNLQRTQEMLLHTNQVARVGGWEFDVLANRVFWSQVTRDIHEVEDEFVPDLEAALGFYKGESKDKIVTAFENAITGGGDYSMEVELTTGKGRVIWVHAMGHAEVENGQCKRIYGTFQDIDEKKKIELEVNNSRKMLDNVLNSASEVSIIATDKEGVITVFNKGAEKLLGYFAHEVVGSATLEIIHLASEISDRSKQLSLEYGIPVTGFRTFVHKAECESSEIGEWTYKTKSGNLIPVSLVVTVIRDYHNEIIGYLGVATDLSARRRVEKELSEERARLMAFVEHAPAAVAMFDRNIRYLAMSHKWIEDYRLEGTNILGVSHYEVFPDIGQAWKDIHSRCLSGDIISNEEDVWRPNGWEQDQYLSWEVRPWYLFEGGIGGLMMFTRDVTESVQQREELRQARAQSEQANVAKSEFLANMSHEIRTPLNGIIGFTELVLKTNLSQTQSQYLNIVNQSANALLTVINDILDFSKIEAGKLDLEIERCDIYELLAQSSDIISYPVQQKGLEMLFDLPSGLPRFVWVDGVRLKQVLINLLSNAAKFTETGEIELKVEMLAEEDQATDEVICRFSVRDTGIGIKADKQEKIFTAFAQEDGTITKKYGGTGLGLTISNKLLAMMGSRLQLESSHGTGSTFYFDLTLKSEQGLPIVWKNTSVTRKLLIVDDNEHNRLIIKNMLQMFAIECDLASSGRQALDLIATRDYDGVILDYHMPVMDGLETIGRVRDNILFKKLPIILLTSSVNDAAVAAASGLLGIKHRVIKPVKLDDIALCLSSLFEAEAPGLRELTQPDTSPTLSQKSLILIAEDNPNNMFLAKTIVRRIMPNAKIFEAKNGLEAVASCQRNHPNLVFMDIQMPEMNGYDAASAIRQLPQGDDVVIIALTAGSVKGERERCLDAGMDDFISKPFVENAIRQILDKYLNLTPEIALASQISASKNDHFDLEKIKEIFMGDEMLIAEFLILTEQTLINGISDLKESYEKKDLVAINAIGHSIKGAASSAYLIRVVKIAEQLEYASKFEKDVLSDLINQMEHEFKLVSQMLDQ